MLSYRPARALLTGLACLGVAFAAHSASLSDESLTPAAFPAAAESIRSDLQSGGAHDELDTEKKAAIEQSLERIEQYLIDPQAHADRIEQEQTYVNALLATQVANSSSGSEKVCRREKRMGSNIAQTVCYKRSDLDARAKDTQNALQGYQNKRPGGEQ